MLGAIIGDMVGAPFEFDRGNKSKEFQLFSGYSHWTDDSVMTIAVAEALLSVEKDAEDEAIRTSVIEHMRKWGKAYPYAGYGTGFSEWLDSDNPKPYGSYGNGSAMRVSSVGWLYDDLERTQDVASLTADVTHNHVEGIKGAEAVAAAIFLARTGSSKAEMSNLNADMICRERAMRYVLHITISRAVKRLCQRLSRRFLKGKTLKMSSERQSLLAVIVILLLA